MGFERLRSAFELTEIPHVDVPRVQAQKPGQMSDSIPSVCPNDLKTLPLQLSGRDKDGEHSLESAGHLTYA